MTTRAIGNSGLFVHPIGFGAMALSLATRPPEPQAIATLEAALRIGIDFIDTADVYCTDQHDIGHSERLIAKVLRDWRRPVVVATKGGLLRPDGAWVRDGRPVHLRSACDASLRALGVQAIDLYQLHAPDPAVPFEDSVGALAELRAQGKIRHIGLSNVTVDQIRSALRIVPIVSVQNRCNILDRRAWIDGVLSFCEQHHLAFLPWSPVGGGRERDAIARHGTLISIAKRHRVSPQRVALAWLLQKSPVIIPIPGASTPAHVVDSANAMLLEFDATDWIELDRAFPTEPHGRERIASHLS